MPTQFGRDSQKERQELIQNSNSHRSSTGEKIAIGTVIVTVLSFLTALITHGGLDLIKLFVWKPNNTSPEPTAPATPQPTPPSQAPISSSPEPAPSISPVPPSPRSTTPTSQSSPADSSATTVEASGFSFKNQGCRGGTEVTCTFLINSKREDARLYLYANSFVGASRVVDLNGNEYRATNVRLASDRGGQAEAVLAQNIPLKAEVTFSRLPTQTTQVALLELSAASRGPFKVQLRDVPISSDSK